MIFNKKIKHLISSFVLSFIVWGDEQLLSRYRIIRSLKDQKFSSKIKDLLGFRSGIFEKIEFLSQFLAMLNIKSVPNSSFGARKPHVFLFLDLVCLLWLC